MAGNEDHLTSEESFTVESPHVILFIFLTFGIGALFRSIIRILNLHIPYTAIVFIFGGCIGWLSHEFTIIDEYTIVSNAEPKHILIAFLPALIFRTAFSMDAHTFLRSFPQIVIVAVPGFLISASCLGLVMQYLFDYKWSWEVSFLFGIIISTIYPYEVVSLFRELGQSKYVSILLEGEALLTDGSAMVCFNILHGYITGQVTDGALNYGRSTKQIHSEYEEYEETTDDDDVEITDTQEETKKTYPT